MASLDGAFEMSENPPPQSPTRPGQTTMNSTGAGAGSQGSVSLPTSTNNPDGGSGDQGSVSTRAWLVALLILVFGTGIALVMPETKAPFKAVDGFILLTGFLIAAQAIERFLELTAAGWHWTQSKPDRSIIISAIAFVLAVLLCENLGLYLLQALGATAVSGDLDVIITALAIGGGTKPLHDFIKTIEKAKGNS